MVDRKDRESDANPEPLGSADPSPAAKASELIENFRHQLHDMQRAIVQLEQDARAMPEIASALELDVKIDERPVVLPQLADSVELEERDIELKARSAGLAIDRGGWDSRALRKDGDTYAPIETYGKVRLKLTDEAGEAFGNARFRLLARDAAGRELTLAERAADAHGYASVDLNHVRADQFAGLAVEVRQPVGEDAGASGAESLRFEIAEQQLSSHKALGIAHRLRVRGDLVRAPGGLRANPVEDPDADDLSNSPESFGLNEEHVDGNCCLRPNADLPARQYFFRQIVRAQRPQRVTSLAASSTLVAREDIRGPVPYLGESARTYAVRAAQPMLGFVNKYRIGWFPRGRSLGEVLYSLALAPCEQVNLAFIDWTRSERDTRVDATVATERLAHEQHHDRAIEESVDSVLHETQSGSSSSGGGGLSIDLGFFSIGGGGGGTSSSTEGRRSLQADTVQEVSDRIVQRSSAIRSRRSTVVTTSYQRESERIQTRTVRNHNRNHAMTVQYFQVISNYEVRTELVEEQPVLLIPYAIDPAIFDTIPSFNKFRASPSRPITRFLDRHKSVLERAVPRHFRDNFAALRRLLHCADIYGAEAEFATASRWRINIDKNVRRGVDLAITTVDGQLVPLRPLGRPGSGYVEYASDPVRLDRIETLRVNFDPEAAIQDVASGLPGALGNIVEQALELGMKYRIERVDIIARTDINRFLPQRRNLQITLAGAADAELSVDNPSTEFQLDAPDIDFASAQTQQKRDYCELKELIAHIQERPLFYLRLIWLQEDPERRAMRFDRLLFNGLPLIDRIQNRPVGVQGNYVAFPLLEGRRLVEQETPEHFVSKRLVTLPTRGVFAEVFLSCCNATEKMDVERLRTPETECAGEAPQIAPITAGSRRDRADTTPAGLPAPMVNIQAPPAIPDPAGLSGALNVLGTPNIFRDLSRGAELLQFINNATKEAFTSTRQHRAAMDQLAGDILRGVVSAYTGVPIGSSGGGGGAAASGTAPISSPSGDGAGAVRNTTPGRSAASPAAGAMGQVGSADVRDTSPSQLAAQLQNVRRAYEQGQISEAQMRERSNSLLGGVSAGTLDDGNEPVILLEQGAGTEARAFGPSSADAGNTLDLAVRVRNLPDGGQGRFAREDSARTHISHRAGTATTVTGVLPGLSAIDYLVEDAAGATRASIKIPVSVPQFVQVVEEAAALDAALAALQVDDVKVTVLETARNTAAQLLRTANVRVLWTMAPFNEDLPASFQPGQPAAGKATRVTLRGDPPQPGLIGRTPGAPLPGPANPAEDIAVFPGALDDAVGVDLDTTVRLTVQALQAADMTDPDLKHLAIRVIGRAIGFTLAHEILHGLLGFEIPTGHNSPAIPGDIMNHGSELGITDRTGIVVTDNTSFPAPGSFDDQGFGAMARVTATTQAVIDRFFPVPPAF